MAYGKGITKHNKEEYVNWINESLDRFIEYADKYGKTREQVYMEYQKTGEVDSKMIEFKEYGELAKHLKSNLDDVCLHVHGFCFTPNRMGETYYPSNTLRTLYDYRAHCYSNRVRDPEGDFMSLEEQNESARNYVHFDWSVKRIKTLKDI